MDGLAHSSNPEQARRRLHGFSALLIRRQKHEAESDPGYLLRLAHLNGLKRSVWLGDVLPRCAGGTMRLCPLCLSEEEPFWRQSWAIAQEPYCALHRVWLIDRCSGCGFTLRFGRTRFLACGCGQDLRVAAGLEMPKTVENVLFERAVPFRVMMWLGALARHGLQGKPLMKGARRDIAALVELATLGAEVVSGWPHAFHAVLDRCRVQPDPSTPVQIQSEAFPGLHKLIGRMGDVEWEAAVRQCVWDYMDFSESGVGLMVFRRRALTPDDNGIPGSPRRSLPHHGDG